MPTQSISVGPPFTLQTNVAYALPAVQTRIFCDDTAPNLQKSSDVAFTQNKPVTFTDGQSLMPGGGFIRATAGTPTVCLSRA